jgi:hypothetical protein
LPIAELRLLLERLETPGARSDVLPFGVAAVDAALPGGGLARGALHVMIEGGPAGEFAAVAMAGLLPVARDRMSFLGKIVDYPSENLRRSCAA